MRPGCNKMDEMATDTDRELDDLATTARIDRRQTILAQIEAALLADKLSVLETAGETRNGTDPYNRGRVRNSAWDKAKR